MNIYNIIIYDHKNKKYEKHMFISGDMENHITNNIAELQLSNFDVNMHSISDDFSTKELELKGYKNKQGLYEILILEFNNKGEKILKRFA